MASGKSNRNGSEKIELMDDYNKINGGDVYEWVHLRHLMYQSMSILSVHVYFIRLQCLEFDCCGF